MDIKNLKAALTGVMPILDANLSLAHSEYMDASLAAGAYGVVCSRHETALAVLSRTDLQAEQAYKACAALAIDLSSGVRSMPDAVKAQEQVENWWQCYRAAGFTEVNKFFDIPIMPEGTVRM